MLIGIRYNSMQFSESRTHNDVEPVNEKDCGIFCSFNKINVEMRSYNNNVGVGCGTLGSSEFYFLIGREPDSKKLIGDPDTSRRRQASSFTQLYRLTLTMHRDSWSLFCLPHATSIMNILVLYGTMKTVLRFL